MVDIVASIAPIDQSIEDAARERPGEKIKIRVQPAILRHRPGRPGPQFASWKNLHWMIQLSDLTEARALREALTMFFYVASAQGIGVVRDHLARLVPSGSPSSASSLERS